MTSSTCADFAVMQNASYHSWGDATRFQKVTETKQCVAGLDSPQGRQTLAKIVTGNSKLKWKPMMLEIPGSWDIHQGKLQAQSRISSRERICVLHVIGLRGGGFGAHMISRGVPRCQMRN